MVGVGVELHSFRFDALTIPSLARLPIEPRKIDPERAFRSIVDWLKLTVPGQPNLLVMLSGTDSALAFMACAKLIDEGHKLGELLGVHYGESYQWAPWLSKFGKIKITNLKRDEEVIPEYQRWAAAQTVAIRGDYWLVGTRNKTETELGKYTLASRVAVVQPLLELWKSEVLEIGKYFGMPEPLLHSSRCRDNECGRPQILAEHIEEIDRILMVERGLITPEALDQIPTELRLKLQKYIEATKEKNIYRNLIPYHPGPDVLDDAIIE